MLVLFLPSLFWFHRASLLMGNRTRALEAKNHIHIYLHPRQMRKWLAFFPCLNPNPRWKISHWIYQVSLNVPKPFPTHVEWEGGACHLSPNFLSLSIL